MRGLNAAGGYTARTAIRPQQQTAERLQMSVGSHSAPFAAALRTRFFRSHVVCSARDFDSALLRASAVACSRVE